MRRLTASLLAALALVTVACSTRSHVVKPEDVAGLNDPQWTVATEPARRSQ